MAKKVPGKWVIKNGVRYWRIPLFLGTSPTTGKQQIKDFYGKTQKEALKKMEAYKNNNGINIDSSTLGGYMYEWLWNVKKQAIKPSTFERWEGIYRKYIKAYPGIHNAKLETLNNIFFQKVTNELLKETKTVKVHGKKVEKNKYTVNQIKNMNSLIKMCLESAIDNCVLNVNPLRKIEYTSQTEYVEEENEKVNYIDEDEQRKLVAALKGDELEGVILTGLYCGMRVGEILALTTKDIDFKNGIININKSVKYVWTGKRNSNGKKIYEYRIQYPKSKNSKRQMPLPKKLIPVFKDAIRKNAFNRSYYGEAYNTKINLVFCTELGYFIDSKKPNRHLKKALKKADIKENICFHSLRHIFITNCVDADINPKTVMGWVGHSDITITLNIYAEASKRKSFKEFDKLSQSINI